MTVRFKRRRETGVRKVNTGANTFTVSVDFVPNFIDVKFYDRAKKPTNPALGADRVNWTATVTATGYDFDFSYNVNEPREIRWVIARLPVDPEHSINH